MGIKYIDAKRLRRVLIGGGKWIQKHESYLNELNVYPVPDGDTGTNMSMTVQTMIKHIEENTNDKISMEKLIEIVEDAVLIGARGNSGTILSQIITGFLKAIEGKKRLIPKDVAIALKNAKDVAYKVVSTPVEGTILTVIRMVSEKANENSDMEYFNEFIDILVETADEAVRITPDLLPKLKEAGVVDSGAMGLYYFFVGMGKILTEIELLTESSVVESEFDKTILNIDHNPNEIKYKYCTEFIILNVDFDIEKFKKEILKIGDSAVFAKSSKKFKTHIHTNNPGKVIDMAAQNGDLEKIKIENMKLQNEGVLESEKDMAKIFVNSKKHFGNNCIITLSDTIELKDEFLKMGADIVILGGQGKNPSVNDILNAVSKIDEEKNIYILPNNKNVIAAANLAAEKSDRALVVIPTKTMLEGLFFFNYPSLSLIEKEKMNTNNYSIEITRAVRQTVVDNIEIEVNDYLVLVDTKIKYVAKNINEAISKIINNLITNNTLNITIVEGVEKHPEIIDKFNKLTNKFTDKVKIVNASMPNYDYYIYIENKEENLSDIAIITDSSSELSQKQIEGKNISVVPIRLDSDGVTYKAGVNLSNEMFWDMLVNQGKLFKSAQPSPKELANLYQDLFRRGYKKILFIPMSSKLSGIGQVAKLAREMVKREDDIRIYDSKSVSIQLGYMVQEASKKAYSSYSINEIINHLDNISQKIKLYIVVDSLKYLYQGGRINKTSQTVGDFLNLKPILSISEGSLYVEKKVFGGDYSAVKYIEKEIIEKSKYQSMYLIHGYGGTSKQLELTNKISENFKQNRKITILHPVVEIGATVGTHAGPVFGVLVVPKLL